MRNLERKLKYDKDRQARLRKEDPEAVREAEKLRKRVQRQRSHKPLSGDAGSPDNPFSYDDPKTKVIVERQSFRNWQRDEQR